MSTITKIFYDSLYVKSQSIASIIFKNN